LPTPSKYASIPFENINFLVLNIAILLISFKKVFAL